MLASPACPGGESAFEARAVVGITDAGAATLVDPPSPAPPRPLDDAPTALDAEAEPEAAAPESDASPAAEDKSSRTAHSSARVASGFFPSTVARFGERPRRLLPAAGADGDGALELPRARRYSASSTLDLSSRLGSHCWTPLRNLTKNAPEASGPSRIRSTRYKPAGRRASSTSDTTCPSPRRKGRRADACRSTGAPRRGVASVCPASASRSV